MSLLYSATTSDRTDLTADGGRDVTRGALLVWAYLTSTNIGRIAVLVDPVNLRNVQDFGIISAGANLAMLHDFVTQDLNATAAFANFTAYGLNKWLRIACVWDHGGGATAQKLYVGDESSGLAEPSAYVTQQDGTGGWQARDASSFWKLGNRRLNDTNLKGRLAYSMLVDRSAGANPTAAEMDRWFKSPGRFDNGVWCYELGVGGDGLSPRNLFGSASFVGTVTGATVDAHLPMKPFLTRSVQGVGSTGDVMQRTRRRAVSPRPVTLLSTFRGAYTTLVIAAARGSVQVTGYPATLSSGLFLAAARGAVFATGRAAGASPGTLAAPAARGGTLVTGRSAVATLGTNAMAAQRGAVLITGRATGNPPAGTASTLILRRGVSRRLILRTPRLP